MEIKPLITTSEIEGVIYQVFGVSPTQTEPIASGEIAASYYFNVDEKAYVIRFAKQSMAAGLYKDLIAVRHFATPDLPIPPVFSVDPFQDLTFAITQKMPGDILDNLTEQEYEATVPSLIHTLHQIHQADLTFIGVGYGRFNDKGIGPFASWSKFLLSVKDEEAEGTFYGKWHNLFETTFLEKSLFDEIYELMASNLAYCTEDRFLIHGDYAFNNVLAKNGKVTAVLDWANAAFGDFMLDVAALNLLKPNIGFNGRFQAYYQSYNIHIPHYNERLLCHSCFAALDGLRYYAKTGQEDGYQWIRRLILHFLENKGK